MSIKFLKDVAISKSNQKKNVFTDLWLFTFFNNEIISKEGDFLRICLEYDSENTLCGISGDKIIPPIFILVYPSWENLLIHPSLWFDHCLELELNLMPPSDAQESLDTRCLGRATVEVPWSSAFSPNNPSFFLFAQLVTGVLEGGYNFFCQDTHSGGEADMKVP